MQLSTPAQKLQIPSPHLQKPIQQLVQSSETSTIRDILICKQEMALINSKQGIQEINVEKEDNSFMERIEYKASQPQIVHSNQTGLKPGEGSNQTVSYCAVPQNHIPHHQHVLKNNTNINISSHNPEHINQQQNQPSTQVQLRNIHIQTDPDQVLSDKRKKQKTQPSKLQSLNKVYHFRKRSSTQMVPKKKLTGDPYENKQTRKYVLHRTQIAESQMMANIQFLKNLKGKGSLASPKYLKQDFSQQKCSLEISKSERRKYLGSLGFASSSQQLPIKSLATTPESPANILSQIRKIRKREKAFALKSAVFNLYSKQKDNENFT